MRHLTVTFLLVAALAGAAAAEDADIPGRLSFGFNVGGCHSANDHSRWSASGTGYCYYGEVAYESTTWLVAPLLQWGYTYATGDLPAWEAGGYSAQPTDVKGEGDTFVLGGRVRVPLWRMKLRPYGGAGVAWTNYDRVVLEEADVLSDNDSFGTGWAALGGLEFFPNPASGFSLCLEYRYAVTKQEWRRPPAVGKALFETEFDLTEKLLTMGVKVYVL